MGGASAEKTLRAVGNNMNNSLLYYCMLRYGVLISGINHFHSIICINLKQFYKFKTLKISDRGQFYNTSRRKLEAKKKRQACVESLRDQGAGVRTYAPPFSDIK